MLANRYYLLILIVLLSVFGYLSYNVIKPFLSPIAWAIVLGIIFYPVYIFIGRFIKWKALVSILTVIIIIVIILGPFSYLSILLGKELSGITYYFNEERLSKFKDLLSNPAIQSALEKIQIAFNIENVDLGAIILENISRVGRALVTNVTLGAKNLLTVLIYFVLMIFTLFFLLKDGPDLIKKTRNHLPFSEIQKDRLFKQIKDLVISTIYGGVILSILEGIFGGIAFFFLGFQAPAIWGIMIGMIAFIPIMGTLWIWIPVDIYLFFNGFIAKGFSLLIVGLILSSIDNFVRPIIIRGRTKMPVLFIFFSVIGGINLFGLIGLIMGPLVFVLFISLFEIFRSIEEGGNNVDA